MSPLTRREVLVGGLTGAAGLAIGFYVPRLRGVRDLLSPGSSSPFSPNAWVEIGGDGHTTITIAASEMGQGVRTSLAMILADELDADWSQVAVRQAPVEEGLYGDQTTGGSDSVASSWDPLRRAGAAAREMLVAAAAKRWSVLPSTCRADKGSVLHPPSGRRATYGELTREAAALPLPASPRLKKPEERTIVGTRRARLDAPAKVNGTAVYGMDVQVPGMAYAALLRCPVYGGKVAGFKPDDARAVAGVRDVLAIPAAAGQPGGAPAGTVALAVVADDSWAAIQGCRRLQVTWDEGPAAALGSAGIRELFVARAATGGVTWRSEGDVAGTTAAAAAASRRLDAVYEMPFLAHAPMEPGNTTARVENGRCELWSPTQAPDRVQRAVAKELGLARDAVTVHTTLLGGGFGRRLQTDYAVEAAKVARAAGRPVKLVWSREDDMGHDFYRPASYHRMAGALDRDGWPVAFEHLLVAPSIAANRSPAALKSGRDPIVESQAVLLYGVPNVKLSYAMANTAVPIGPLRSVYASQAAFPTECFLDELAAAGGKDPLAVRRRLLAADREIEADERKLSTARLRGVLELAAAKAGWGTPLPAGRFRGIACFPSFGTYVAEVAEVSLDPKAQGGFRVERVVVAIDCGIVINPDGLEAQMEGAVVYGLSAARCSAITIRNGRAEQANFDGFEVLRLPDMPRVEVHAVPSTETPSGAGEPGMPPLAPAVANALFAATGKRLRTLPLRVA